MNTPASGCQVGRPIEMMDYDLNGLTMVNTSRIPQHDSQQDGLGSCNSYAEIAQNLRKLRDDDVEMEDASDWPASWDENHLEPQDGKEVADAATDMRCIQRRPAQLSSEEEHPHIVYIALDTNIFISHLGTVQAIHQQLSEVHRNGGDGTEAVTIKLLVPNVVIHELDKQKNMWSETASATQSPSIRTLQASRHAKTSQDPSHPGRASPTLAAAARAAIEWLLRIRQAQRCRGTEQTLGELCIFQKKGQVKDQNVNLLKADDRILDCCEYYQDDIRVFGRKNDVILWTDDKNLGLQAEIHEIPCIGNRSFSVEQVLTAARNACQSQPLAQAFAANNSSIPARSSLLVSAAHASVRPPHTHQQRYHASNGSKDVKARSRGITSSIWANSSQASRKHKTAEQSGKARASSLPLLTTSTTQEPTYQSDFDPASSPSTNRNSPKTVIPPRLADAIAIMESCTSSPSTFNIALGHIIAFPLYDLLLAQVCHGQPTLLRELLGAANLGPGHWSGCDSLQLFIKGWQFGLQPVYTQRYAHSTSPSSTPETCFEAASWLHAFLVGVTTAELHRRGGGEITWVSIPQRGGVIEALRILFVRNSPEWWLDNHHVRAIERLIDWIRLP